MTSASTLPESTQLCTHIHTHIPRQTHLSLACFSVGECHCRHPGLVPASLWRSVPHTDVSLTIVPSYVLGRFILEFHLRRVTPDQCPRGAPIAREGSPQALPSISGDASSPAPHSAQHSLSCPSFQLLQPCAFPEMRGMRGQQATGG